MPLFRKNERQELFELGLLTFDEEQHATLDGFSIRSARECQQVEPDDATLQSLLRIYRPVIRRNRKLFRQGKISRDEILPKRLKILYFSLMALRDPLYWKRNR